KEIFLPSHDESGETDPNLQDLFGLMDGVNDLGAVVEAMPASKFEVMKLVAGLVDCGRLVRATAPHLRDLAQRATATGEPARAIRHLEAALEREHGALDIRRDLAKLYEKTDRTDEAAREHKKIAFDLTASGETRMALEVYERASALAPSDTGTLQKIADIHEAGGDLESFRKAGRRLGETLVAQGLYEDALKVYKRLSKSDENNVALREALAEIHVKLNKPKNAAKEFLPLAERAYNRGDYSEALRQYRNVIRVDRSCVEAAERIDEIESGRIRQYAINRRRRLVAACVAVVAALALWQFLREALATEALQRASISAAIDQPRHTALPGGVFALERFARVRTDFPGTLAAGRAGEAVQMLVLSELDRMAGIAELDPAAVEANVRRIDNVDLSGDTEALWVDGRDRLLSTVRKVRERINGAEVSD
ncbi:MAG: tetratricopeptide repeat protein, partial [Planctomycetota bacterium]